MLNQLNKEIFEHEEKYNIIRMALMRKRLEDLEDSKTVSASRIKSDASIEYEDFINSQNKLNFLKKKFNIEFEDLKFTNRIDSQI